MGTEYLFPHEQKLIIEEQRDIIKSRMKAESMERIQELKGQLPAKLYSRAQAPYHTIGGIAGFVFGLVVLGPLPMVPGLLSTLIAIGVGYLIGKSCKDKAKRELDEKFSENINAQEEETKRLSRELAEVDRIYSDMYNNYVNNFEIVAQSDSAKYAESELAKEVIQWMTEGFCKIIDATDRRSHIAEINVPFVFNVYTNKITCNLGEYDFEIHRCSELNTPIEKVAVSRAIASAIQINTVMKYTLDSSGTPVSIDIDYEYNSQSVVTTITYKAVNGNYKDVGRW